MSLTRGYGRSIPLPYQVAQQIPIGGIRRRYRLFITIKATLVLVVVMVVSYKRCHLANPEDSKTKVGEKLSGFRSSALDVDCWERGLEISAKR